MQGAADLQHLVVEDGALRPGGGDEGTVPQGGQVAGSDLPLLSPGDNEAEGAAVDDQLGHPVLAGEQPLHGKVEVEALLLQGVHQLSAVKKADIHLYLRAALIEGGQAPPQTGGGGGQRGHRDAAHPPLGDVHRPGLGSLQPLQDVGGVVPEGASRLGEAHLMAAAAEQLYLEGLLQRADLTADGGLGDEMAPGRLGKVQRLRHSDEISELVDVHTALSSPVFFSPPV